MKASNTLYKPMDFFMLRRPVLPIEFFEKITFSDYNEKELDNDFYEEIIDLFINHIIRESFTIASTSLLKALDKIKNEKDSKKKEQIIINSIKYLIRMSTRPTPFGLFAGISVGRISGETDIQLTEIKYGKKFTRPDMEWLLSVIHKIEKDIKYVENLKVKTNTIVDFSGERAYLSYKTRYGDDKATEMTSVSVRFTEAVNYVFEVADEPILYKDILNMLYEKYPKDDKKKIQEFLWQLFRTEFLISELKPPLMIKSPFDYFLNKINNKLFLKDKKEDLIKIQELIKDYDNTKIGNGTDIYFDIKEKMKNIHESENYLQTDFVLNTKECKLKKDIVEEIAKTAECLWRLSPEYITRPELVDFRNDFIEKYGIYREIPILELLDPDRGLGSPAGYAFPESRRRVNFNIPNAVTNVERYIQEEIIKNKFNKDNYIIEITDEIISKIEPIRADYATAPVSMELFFSINANSKEELDNGNYELILGPNNGSNGAGKTFGRFYHYIDDEHKEKITKVNEYEKNFYEEAVLAELVYMPESGRSANICISHNYRDYEIVISTNSSKKSQETLDLSDLLIGTTYNSFYIKSKSLGKRVIITTGHMLNLVGVPNVYRFLREITLDGVRSWSQLLRGSVADMPFVPSIKYKKTLLSPAMWNLSWDILKLDSNKVKNNVNKFIKAVERWRKEWRVPRYVYLTENDNRILLDLESKLHLKVLFSETPKLERYSALSLLEAKISKWAKGDEGFFNLEFVVPFIKNKNSNLYRENMESDEQNSTQLNINERINLNRFSDYANNVRLKHPGSEWLFLKLYGNSKREDEFIGNSLRVINKDIIDNNYAEKFFFMRYVDPEPHIRVRFRGKSEILISKLLPEFYNKSLKLIEEGFLSKFVIDTYDREVERYGGPDLIDYAEDIFYKDSIIVEEFLYLLNNKELSFDMEKLAVVSIIDYLESFGLSFEEQMNFLDKLTNRKEYLDDFRESRKIYMKIANTDDDWDGLNNYRDGKIVKIILSKRHIIIKRFIQKFAMLKIKKGLYNEKDDIMASIIHLHCNRLIGIDRIYERKLMTLARHTLYNLRYLKKKSLAK
ncbi:MAG: lantibiotic dehydratase [Clostridiales bacterium]